MTLGDHIQIVLTSGHVITGREIIQPNTGPDSDYEILVICDNGETTKEVYPRGTWKSVSHFADFED